MAIRSITPALPDGSSVYLFGSSGRSDQYADVDLLILYDPVRCPPKEAHHKHQAVVDFVSEIAGAPVHLCLLSYLENNRVDFNIKVSAIPLLQKLHFKPDWP